MAAAYAALVSLMHLIEQIQHHPRPPITLDIEQAQSLTDCIAFLQEILEAINFHGGSKEADGLLSRISGAAYAAEDVIESNVVHQILSQSTTSHDEEKISYVDFYQGLQKVIEAMNFIKKEMMEIKDKMGNQHPLQRIITTPAVSSKSPSAEQKTMVGFDDFLNEMLDKLTGQQSDRQIIPVSGMGGIGKTTLARNVYTNPHIKNHFDICAWATISQEYSIPEILLEVLLCQKNQGNMESLSGESEQDLGSQLHKSLFGRRYLIIIDDMWDFEAWDKIKFFFPDNNNGRRIIVTTRLLKVALNLDDTLGLEMSFLDGDKSWDLFCRTVFGKESCPPELEQIGKRIAKNCKGLPLSIVVIGGLLAKSKQTKDDWESTAENLNSVVNLDDNERCLKILHTSYDQLPIHLKPCFLYMGTFSEDSDIRVSQLIKQWVAQGFLKPVRDKSLEDTAEEYLIDLIERNLILVRRKGLTGKIKICIIHDLLRDLCLREVQEEKFLCITRLHGPNIPQHISTQRHIVIHQSTSQEEYDHPQVFHYLESGSLVRSLMCHFYDDLPSLHHLRLLRIILKEKVNAYRPIEDIFHLVNLRSIDVSYHSSLYFDSPLYLCWNLQSLKLGYYPDSFARLDIWKMPLLRHVEIPDLYLSDPPSGQMNKQDDFILGNLQTLSSIQYFVCSEKVIKRIPNVKKLQISYGYESDCAFDPAVESDCCLNNLGRLHKLESLGCFFPSNMAGRSDLLQNLTFPVSLKKLTLLGTGLHWEDMSIKIGALPLLQVLKLQEYSFTGAEWETGEGQFRSLRVLLIDRCSDLKYWRAESTHFPCLEHLILKHLYRLKEIPSGIGEIPTLESIQLVNCSSSSCISAKQVLEEQEQYGNEDTQVRVECRGEDQLREMESLASRNFQVSGFGKYI